MSDLKFTKEHEWIKLEDGIMTIGITQFAQEQLGDIVFIELPEAEDDIREGQEVAVIESVKAAGEIHSPVDGQVVEVNEELGEAPETVNQDPYGAGWFFRARVEGDITLGDFMDEEEYNEYLEECQ